MDYPVWPAWILAVYAIFAAFVSLRIALRRGETIQIFLLWWVTTFLGLLFAFVLAKAISGWAIRGGGWAP